MLDEIERAKDAGDLEEGSPFRSITNKFEDVLTKLGITKFGAKGDIFDPNLHDALMNRDAIDGEDLKPGEVIVDNILEPGYKLNDEIFRTAKVATVSA
jgi:molecular chaperone GrpE